MMIATATLSKLAAVVALGSVVVSAFAPSTIGVHDESRTILNAQPSASNGINSVGGRRAFLVGGTGFAVLTGAVVSPQPAAAAKYGDFGAGSPLVLDPKTADVDEQMLSSSSVQGALSKVRDYQEAVSRMQQALKADPQADVKPVIRKELDFANLRTTLNQVNEVFDEDTQRGTDRLIRVILQDITELETANTQKDGVARSPRRLEIMEGKLAKLDKAFSDYLAFAK